jgi:hypothetical protein
VLTRRASLPPGSCNSRWAIAVPSSSSRVGITRPRIPPMPVTLADMPEPVEPAPAPPSGGDITTELLLLPLPCSFSYAVQRLGHTSPALRPVRALLVRVSLGPRPWLRQLRRRSPGFVHRLRRYYAGVRLHWIVYQRLRLLTFPLRTVRRQQRLWPIQRSPGSRARSVRTCQGLRPRRVRRALA